MLKPILEIVLYVLTITTLCVHWNVNYCRSGNFADFGTFNFRHLASISRSTVITFLYYALQASDTSVVQAADLQPQMIVNWNMCLLHLQFKDTSLFRVATSLGWFPRTHYFYLCHLTHLLVARRGSGEWWSVDVMLLLRCCLWANGSSC